MKKIINKKYRAFFNVLLTPLFIAFISCSDGSQGSAGPAYTPYFISDKIEIKQGDEQILFISFNDSKNEDVEVEGIFSKEDQTLYNENEIKLVLTADGLIELIEPYKGVSGTRGTAVYSVRKDKTAVHTMQDGRTVEYMFYFADSETGEVEYSACLIHDDLGRLWAEFTDTSSIVLGETRVIISTHPDTSQTLTINNTYGSGAETISVSRPAPHDNLQSIIISMPDLRAYLITDGNYMIDLYDGTGAIIFNINQKPEGMEETIFDQDGITITMGEDNEIFCTKPAGTGMRTIGVIIEGVAVEHLKTGEDNTYRLFFINDNGAVEYIANIVKVGDFWYARFEAPIDEEVLLSIGSDLFGNIYFIIDFDNAAGNGEIEIDINSDGDLTGITYTENP